MSITRNVAAKYKERITEVTMVPIEEATMVSQHTEQADVRGVPLEEVLRMVERLPEGYGQVFRLSVFEGLSHKEIAAMLGIEPHSSSSQLARAKKMLRKMMQQYWAAMLLLLLMPLTFFLLRKGDTSVEEKPAIAKQKDTPNQKTQTNEPSTERPQEPVMVQIPIHHTPIDTLQSVIVQAVDSITPDTLLNMMAQEQVVPDTTATDTTNMLRKADLPHYDIADLFPEKPSGRSRNGQKWSVELAYAGQLSEQSRYNQPYTYRPAPSATQSLPGPGPSPVVPSSIDNWSDYAVYLANHSDAMSDKTRSVIMRIALNNANQPGNDKLLRTSHHRMPVTWSLALKYKLDDRWGIETGLGYSRLSSDFEMGSNGNTINEQQTIHYIGIPMKGIFHIYNNKVWSLYGSAGLTMEIPVSSTLRSDYFINGQYETTDETTIRAPWQWSVGTGLGLQYNLTPAIGLFAEPSLQYYIPTGSDVETFRTEHPSSFSLPLGIRFTW